jgi:hypothetical protein
MKIAGKIDTGKLALATGFWLLATLLISGSEQPSVRVEPADASSPRALEKQTEAAVIRDYLLAWQSLSSALDSNRTDLLDATFVGLAKEKLTDTIQEQQKLGIQTRYTALSHDIKPVFYSPEGLSVQLLDTVEYDVHLLDHDKQLSTQHVRARYVAVLTPTEVRWKVRIFQAEREWLHSAELGRLPDNANAL